MRVPIEWLKEFCPLKETEEEYVRLLTNIGFEATALGKVEGEWVLDIETPSNRTDVLSVLGVAREISAATGTPLSYPPVQELPTHPPPIGGISIVIQNPRECQRYAGMVATIESRETPMEIQRRLIQCGLRPLHPIVDLTNYVMLEVGQPTHAFDLERIEGSCIVVRRAKKDETLFTLDGLSRNLSRHHLVIADQKKPIAIAGVIGGEEASIGPFTSRVFFESAYFSPSSIRRTAKEQKLRTESSYRFERNVSPDGIPLALQRMAYLLNQYGLGKPSSFIAEVYPLPFPMRSLHYRYRKVREVLGYEIPISRQREILQSTGFSPVETKGGVRVHIPPWRPDIILTEDVIEDIARIYGYEKNPGVVQFHPFTAGRLDRGIALEMRGREILASLGLQEILTIPLLKSDSRWRDTLTQYPGIPLTNPLTQDMAFLRPTLLPGLLKTAQINESRQVRSSGFFEIGRVFLQSPQGRREERRVAFLLPESSDEPDWKTGKKYHSFDFFDAKGLVEVFLAALTPKPILFQAIAERIPFHPHRQTEIQLEKQRIGILGELHTHLLSDFDLSGKFWYAELLLEPSLYEAERTPYYASLPVYPPVYRDLSIQVPLVIAQSEVQNIIRQAGGNLLVDLALFDVYRGKGIPDEEVGLTYNLRFRHPERTLKEEEVENCIEAILKELNRKGIHLRE